MQAAKLFAEKRPLHLRLFGIGELVRIGRRLARHHIRRVTGEGLRLFHIDTLRRPLVANAGIREEFPADRVFRDERSVRDERVQNGFRHAHFQRGKGLARLVETRERVLLHDGHGRRVERRRHGRPAGAVRQPRAVAVHLPVLATLDGQGRVFLPQLQGDAGMRGSGRGVEPMRGLVIRLHIRQLGSVRALFGVTFHVDRVEPDRLTVRLRRDSRRDPVSGRGFVVPVAVRPVVVRIGFLLCQGRLTGFLGFGRFPLALLRGCLSCHCVTSGTLSGSTAQAMSTHPKLKGANVREWAGIDPGGTGGFAVFDRSGMIDGGPMKLDNLFRLERRLCNCDVILLERAQGAPGQANQFQYGRNFGLVEAVAILSRAEILYVSPVTWKSKLTVSTDKAKAVERARRLIPNVRDFMKSDADHGTAEAALIAYFLGTDGARDFLDAKSAERTKRKARKSVQFRL